MNISRRLALTSLAAVYAACRPCYCLCAVRDHPRRAADQDLLADHDRRDRGAAKAVREGRHHGRTDDLSQRRRRPSKAWRQAPPTSSSIRRRWYRAGRKKGVMSQDRRQRRDGQFRLAVDGADEIDARRQGPQRQEGRDHGGRLRLRPAGAVDHPGPEDRFHPRAGRRRRPGAQPARRQCRRGRRLFAAQLPDRARPARRDTILDYSSRKCRRTSTAGWIVLDKYAQEKPQIVQKALNALYGARAVHARQQRDVDGEADRRSLRDAGRDRRAANTRTPS